MTTQDAVDFFGSVTSVASVLGLTRGAVYKWGEYPPNETQYKLMVLSCGRLAVTNDNTTKDKKND
jgi:hypothetical protein